MSGSLGVLTTSTESPIMTKTTMRADLLQTLQVLTKLVVENVGHHLGSLAVLDISLSVQEPIRDLVLSWVLKKSR